MSAICVNVDDPSLRKECGALTLDCVYPQEGQEVNAHMRPDQRPPEWADASEEVEASTRFEAASPPEGMGPYDPGALSQYQQKRLNQLKVATTKGNYKYLADHPELKAMITLFLQHLLKTRPKNLRASAGEFFSSEKTLAQQIRRFLGMTFWKPPARETASPGTQGVSAAATRPETPEEEEEEELSDEETQTPSTLTVDDKEREDSSSGTSKRSTNVEPPQLSGDSQLFRMMEMAESYDSKLILDLSTKRSEDRRTLTSAFAFRKQVSFGGSLLSRTPGWEVDPNYHFFVEDIQPEITELYSKEKPLQKKLKFMG